jgi:hypothetical protein
VARILVAIWLFLGCVALTEQLQVTPETSAQDEQALLQLASCIKPDQPHLEAAWSSSGITNANVFLSFFSVEENVDLQTFGIVPAVSTLRLHQLVSVYRI